MVQAGAGLSFLHAAMNEGPNLEPLVTSAVAEGVVRFGGDWPDEIRKPALSMNLDVVRVARLFLALPDTRSWPAKNSGHLVEVAAVLPTQ